MIVKRKQKQCVSHKPEKNSNNDRYSRQNNRCIFILFIHCNIQNLGPFLTPLLKDDLDIRRRINQANGAFTTMKQILCNKDIPAKTLI